MEDRLDDPSVEQLLEAALTGYSRVQPRPGLEERLLAVIRSTPQPPARPWWLWATVAATALAAVLVAAVFIERQPSPSREFARTTAQYGPVAANRGARSPAHEAPGTATRREERRLAATKKPAPRQEQFPTPAPLSEQETLLLRYLEAVPAAALPALGTRAQTIEALSIADLLLPALTIEGLTPAPGPER